MPGNGPAPSRLSRRLAYRDLLAFGLAYIALVAPLTTLGFVWNASGGMIVLPYLLGALCMYFTARSYATMTEEVPNAGSVYGFAHHGLGPLPGFLAGWAILLDYLLIPALLYLMMSVGLTAVVPQVSRTTWIVLLVASSVGINWFGIGVTSRVNRFSVAVQCGIVLVLLALGIHALYAGETAGGLTLAPLYSADVFSLDKILAATSICIFSFLGFDAISTLAEEVKDTDRKLVGRAIVHVLLISGTVFVLMAWVLGDLLKGVVIDDPAVAIFELATHRFGEEFSMALALLLVFVVGFTNALPMQTGVARVLFAMGRDRQLPSSLARIHEKHGTPHVAMLLAGIVSLGIALAMQDALDMLAVIVNFGALAAFLLLHLSVLAHMMWRKRSRRYFAHLCVPLLGIAVVLMIFSGMAAEALQTGTIWLVVGIAYGLYLRARRRVELAAS